MQQSFASKLNAIGLMSAHHDGLDICLEFNYCNGDWKYDILNAQTVVYPQDLSQRLYNSMSLGARELALLDADYGQWIGKQVKLFLDRHHINADIIGSHGHTVFHEPHRGFTTQIGSGAHIAAISGIPCVCNFRMGDVARGGQGAPLVPIGDELLFGDFQFCLNLGGFANVSYRKANKRVAFDICPANIVFNLLSQRLGKKFDDCGRIGQKGEVDENLLEKLNCLPYYQRKGAKSLGKEWVIENFLPLIESEEISIENKLRTLYEHVSYQISKVLSDKQDERVLVTGGGAKNEFLMELLTIKTKNTITIPPTVLVDFKEALIFGLLAILYLHKIPSCIASATGASENSIGGTLFY